MVDYDSFNLTNGNFIQLNLVTPSVGDSCSRIGGIWYFSNFEVLKEIFTFLVLSIFIDIYQFFEKFQKTAFSPRSIS